jgi:DNA-binding Xre family transcriptional regulator
MELNQAFAKRVKEILKEKKMTQYKLAQETGLYHSTLNDILTCKYKTANFKNMSLIIRELGCSYIDFFNSPLFNFDNIELDD